MLLANLSDGDPLDIAAAWLEAGRQVALATVVETWGSSPRPVGSLLVVDDVGRFAGSVSAGCVENLVIEAATEALHDGGSRLLSFGVSDEDAWLVGLTCGGSIRVRVERIG